MVYGEQCQKSFKVNLVQTRCQKHNGKDTVQDTVCESAEVSRYRPPPSWKTGEGGSVYRTMGMIRD